LPVNPRHADGADDDPQRQSRDGHADQDLGGPKALQDWVEFNGFTILRVDRTIARLLADKRDLWDFRDSSTPLAMVDCFSGSTRATS
jgi:hypothetical protein